MPFRSLLLLPLILLLAPVAPGDPRFDDQWALNQVGAICAWERTTGSADVIVAIIDSGVDLTHPDLLGRVRADGYDFVDDDSDPSDENGHGTHVAGIVAAALDNGEGGVGLAPGVSILPVRVMNARGKGSDASIAQGIRFAADRGARIINLSLGATLMISADSSSPDVNRALRYAQDRGALIVVSAGNDYVPLPNAIAVDNPDVLVVAATDPRDRKADFSNSGPWVGVSAPGVQILSTMPMYEVYLTSDAVPRDERFRNGYDYMSGTSQAAPYVSALAALLFSAHPDWDAAQVARTIRSNATDISERNPELELGAGRMDACKSLGGPPAAEAPQPAPRQPVTSSLSEALFGLLALGACGVTLMLVLLAVGIARMGRRPASRPAPAPAPVYVPPARVPPQPYPPVAPQPQPYQPAAQPQRAAPAAPPPGAWGSLTVIAGPAQHQPFALSGSEALIGRSEECQIVLLGDGTISRRHAIVRNNGRQVTVEDAGSSHGTYLNGIRVTQAIPVRRGDVVQVGQTQLRFG